MKFGPCWCALTTSALALSLSACSNGPPPPLPPPAEPPASQLRVAGNACGPAALLNSLRHATLPWRRAITPLSGTTDRARMIDIIRWQGMQPSRYTPGKPRWSRRGVSVADLADMAAGMTSRYALPSPTHEVDFRKSADTPLAFAKRTHRKFCKSLSAGFPPILSIRRIAWPRRPLQSPTPRTVDAHFVSLTEISSQDPVSGAFQITCVDPWGGTTTHAFIQLPAMPVFPDHSGQTSCLIIDLPTADIGKNSVTSNEQSILILGASIGVW